MQGEYTIFVVDDDQTARLLLQTVLGAQFCVETFESGEACLERIAQCMPDLFLLDVGLPGMDGHTLCRHIKAMPAGAQVPVIFVSGHDDHEAVLAGYDAGAQDYVVKPFDVAGLFRKIENLQRIDQEKRSLQGQAQASEELVSLVLANLDEYAILIKFLRTLSECEIYTDVVSAIQHVLDAYHLTGAVQIRMRNLEKTYSKCGENWPMELAVISHVRTMGRIFEFKNRSAYNFDHLTVLVTNMPVDDSELCGRIRDNISIAADSADAKLRALQSFADNAWMQNEIHQLLQGLERTILNFGKRYDDARYHGSEFTARLLDDLTAAFAHLGMTEQQEDEIFEMVKASVFALIDAYDIAGDTQQALSDITGRLEVILQSSNA